MTEINFPSIHYLKKRAQQDPDAVSFFAVGSCHTENGDLKDTEYSIIIVKGGDASRLVYESLIRSGLLKRGKLIPS